MLDWVDNSSLTIGHAENGFLVKVMRTVTTDMAQVKLKKAIGKKCVQTRGDKAKCFTINSWGLFFNFWGPQLHNGIAAKFIFPF